MPRNKFLLTFFTLGVISSPSSAHADYVTVEQLSRVLEQNALLSAQVVQAELKRQLLPESNVDSSATAQRESIYDQDVRPAPTHIASPPRLSGIYGSGGRLIATLEIDGRRFDVSPGQRLPDGSRVVSINATHVTLQEPSGKGKAWQLMLGSEGK